MIPDQLRTGLVQDPSHEKEITETQKKLLAMVILLVKKATATAAVYCRHQGIEEVNEDHIRSSLKVESMRFFDSDSLEQETANVQAQLEAWDEAMLDKDDSVERVINNLVEQVENDVLDTDDVTTGLCRCQLCSDMEAIHTRWEEYHPEDHAKQFLKHQIDVIDRMYDLE